MRTQGNTGQGEPARELEVTAPQAIQVESTIQAFEDTTLYTGVLAHVETARDLIDRAMRHEVARHIGNRYQEPDVACRALTLDLAYVKGVLTVLLECVKET